MQHFGHLVAALSTANIYNDIRIAPFCQRFLQYCFTGSEAAGNSGTPATRNREHRIQYTLTGHHHCVRWKALAYRARYPHRPAMAQGQVDVCAIGRGDGADSLVVCECAFGNAGNHGLGNMRWHDCKLLVRRSRNRSESHSCTQRIALFHQRFEIITDDLGIGLEWSQKTIENITQQPRSQLDRQGLPGAFDDVPGAQSGRVVVNLDGAAGIRQANDLAQQSVRANVNRLAHTQPAMADCLNHWSGNR